MVRKRARKSPDGDELEKLVKNENSDDGLLLSQTDLDAKETGQLIKNYHASWHCNFKPANIKWRHKINHRPGFIMQAMNPQYDSTSGHEAKYRLAFAIDLSCSAYCQWCDKHTIEFEFCRPLNTWIWNTKSQITTFQAELLLSSNPVIEVLWSKVLSPWRHIGEFVLSLSYELSVWLQFFCINYHIC